MPAVQKRMPYLLAVYSSLDHAHFCVFRFQITHGPSHERGNGFHDIFNSL